MPGLHGITILNVEDYATSREATSELLRQSGAEVIESATGEEALRLVKETQPHLVLLDVNLPDLSGFDVCRRLKSDPTTANVPILQISASFAGGENRVKGLESGCDAYLVKPVEVAELLATIRALLRMHRAEQAQRETEARFQLLFEGNPMPCLVLDRETLCYLAVNEAAARHYGYTREEFVGLPASNLRPAESVPAMLDYLAKIPNVPNAAQWQHRKKDGSLIDVEIIWHELIYQGHNALFVMVNDITERKRAERELMLSNERFRLAEAASNGFVYEWFPDTNAVRRSEGVKKVLGYTNEEMVADREWWGQNLHPEDLEPASTAVREALEHEEGYSVEYRVRHRDGHYVYVWDRGLVFRDAEGRAERVIGSTVDITERKTIEDALRESEERFRTLANSAPVLIWINGVNNGCEYVNKAYLDFFGKRMEEVQGEGWRSHIHPDDDESYVGAYLEAFARRVPFHARVRLLHASGDYRWVESAGVPRFSPAGEFLGYVGASYDITDIKSAESEREQLLAQAQTAREEADAANRAKDEFLAVVSHELRAPLNAMLGWSRILQSRQVDEATQARALDTIEKSARMQAQIVEDLLDTARIISGKLRIESQPVNLVPVVKSALEVVRPAAEAKEITLQVKLAATTDIITGDPDRLQQVVWNLLSNAIKFTPSGGRVIIELRRADPYLQLVVADTGRGISADFLSHVFDRFYQADSTSTRRHSGLGLGLSLVRHLVELHGGTIAAASDGDNLGAVFTVNLPLRAVRPLPHGKGSQASPSRARGQSVSLVLEGVRVLVVDDEKDARDLVQMLLNQYGAEVISVGSAGEAYAVISQGDGSLPHLLISDIGMPEEDGYSLIRRLRQLPPENGGRLPAIALTAYGRATDRLKTQEAGFQSHVTKPVEAAELVAVVAELTGRGTEAEETGTPVAE